MLQPRLVNLSTIGDVELKIRAPKQVLTAWANISFQN